jgi:FkbM family methyltransferase
MIGLDELRWAASVARFLRRNPLTRKRVGRGMARALGLQLAWKILGYRALVVPFVNDAELILRPGMPGATGNFYGGLHDFADMSFLLHALREGDLFVDVGANVGTYTVLASAVRRARSVAFEPIARTRDRLIDTLRLNHIEDLVSVRPVAVGGKPGTLELSSDLDAMNRALAADERYGGITERVALVTLDDALEGQSPALLKIDVEGYEGEVLSGATRTLRSPGLLGIIAEFNASSLRYGTEETPILRLLAENGFLPHSYSPFTRTLQPFKGERSSPNLILARDLPALRERVGSAPRFRVIGQEI